ncbi:unnamed protein product [Schistosoma curassoni]|uniref:Guanylate kinase-like domain-containing protein n=1 Tax=Schistosoma curassoni TaxID=6186 RepID=A0A183K5Y1_9TREM|nr:unnamed protein product [Schistosoma curassoni]
MQYGISEGKFDAVIVNDNADKMVQEVVDVIRQFNSKSSLSILKTSSAQLYQAGKIWDSEMATKVVAPRYIISCPMHKR